MNVRLLFITALAAGLLAWLGATRLSIDFDVARSLPATDRIIGDGLRIFEHHPFHDRVAVDVAINRDDPDSLVACALFIEERMKQSGLFAQVGEEALGEQLPALALHVARNLPLLFSAQELSAFAPMLEPRRLRQRLSLLREELAGLRGVGQAALISADPLGMREQVLAKLALLAPSLQVSLYRGKLLSADSRHLLITARPRAAGTDTAQARAISALFTELGEEIGHRFPAPTTVTLTPVGAYRAALDNELIIRHDVRLALLLATGAIALLLLLSFSRPLAGLLCLAPALAGSAAALFVYSLIFPSISVMVLGFGGAVVSITVDHGIAYLFFLDQPESGGEKAAREVKAVGLMAVVTTIAAFLVLAGSGFTIFTQLGIFTALGLLFSFLFVHTLLPRIMPAMPAGTHRSRPLTALVNALYATGRPGALAAAGVACVLLVFARPDFHVSLASMNTVRPATEAADNLVSSVWGKLDERIFLMNSAASIEELQQRNDHLLASLETEQSRGGIKGFFVPSMLFPGQQRAAANLAAWRAFWNPSRLQTMRTNLHAGAAELGFSNEAFAPFFASCASASLPNSLAPPTSLHDFLGISRQGEAGGLIQFITMSPGPAYEPEEFFQRHAEQAAIFDAALFSKRLAAILFSTFSTMLAIIAASIAMLLFLVNVSIMQTALTLLPALFSFICTLGTLRLLGRPLDIPALMLSIVILGLGIDYAIFCVRAHQRYRRIDHPAYIQVRGAVFLAGASTLIGFGVLMFAEHSLLKSIGLTSFLAIFYSLIGTFLLLPPLLTWLFRVKRQTSAGDLHARIRQRYASFEAYPRLFARFKLRFDPMFSELESLLASRKQIRTILDIGCGYAVPACWCAERYAGARVRALEPDPERVRVAQIALGKQGEVVQGWAPNLPPASMAVDVALLLDMLHYLDDETVLELLKRCYSVLDHGALLVARFTLPPGERPSWSWRLELFRVRRAGGRAWLRGCEETAGLARRAGFTVLTCSVTRGNPELAWLVARRDG